MKHEWKEHEKQFYLPPGTPTLVDIPSFGYFMLDGRGNPNDPMFAECIAVLYSLSYAVKMSPKKGIAPEGFFDYTVYPLEGLWDISEEAKATFTGAIDKDSLVYTLMMRQPGFVSPEFARLIVERARKSKPHPLHEGVRFESATEGLCVQMLHVGSYDSEPASFAAMEAYCSRSGLRRRSLRHREIYLSDARRVHPDKLKTVLRFGVVRTDGM